jgi:hypothetical protein
MTNQKNTTPEISQKLGEKLPVYYAQVLGSSILIVLDSNNFRTFHSWIAARKSLGRFKLANAASFFPRVSAIVEGE